MKISFCLLVALLISLDLGVNCAAADAKKPPLKWQTLLNCRFMPEEHRDGDSFHMMTSDRKEFIFRLYFVDAPETDISVKDRVREQAEYFGVSEEEILKAGESARKFSAEWLRRSCTVTTRLQNAQGRSRLPRYYAQIDVGGKDLGELLVTSGWARAKGTVAILPDGKPVKEHMGKLQKLEAEAKAKHIGIWAHSKRVAGEGVQR